MSVCIVLLFAVLCSATLPPGWEQQIKKVHLVYMTHLDVGYTLPKVSQVIDEYIQKWFPKSFATSKALEAAGGEERFTWTTHPWLVMQYLNNSTGTVSANEIQALEYAIKKGWIQWHALPFNMEPEVSEPTLFGYGIQGLSHKLDRRFGKPLKLAGSQKDVPGSTLGVIDQLANNGVEYLNVGVNDFSMPPALADGKSIQKYAPSEPFVWRNPVTKKELICTWSSGYSKNYNASGATAPELISARPGSSVALVFLMHVDNTGPLSPEEVKTGWASLRKIFPNAAIHASSLDEYAKDDLIPNKHALPVFEKEIGDFWIRGIASDPRRMSLYRQVAALRAAALAENSISLSDPRIQRFSELLLKQPEHTWGYNAGDLMGKAGAFYGNDYLKKHYNDPNGPFQVNLGSYRSQFDWLTKAIDQLDTTTKFYKSIQDIKIRMTPVRPATLGYNNYIAGQQATCGRTTLAFDQHGAISNLRRGQRVWAGNSGKIGTLLYVTNNEQEQKDYISKAMWAPCSTDCGGCGFIKCNISEAAAESKTVPVSVSQGWESTDGCSFIFKGTFELHYQQKYGAPPEVWVEVNVSDAEITWTVTYFGKQPTRLPESLWMSFIPTITSSEARTWEANKMAMWVSPYDVANNGSKAIHGIWDGVRLNQGEVKIRSPEIPLVLFGRVSPLVFLGDSPLDEKQVAQYGVSFNIFNNQWTTNYPVFLFDSQFKSTFSWKWDDKRN